MFFWVPNGIVLGQQYDSWGCGSRYAADALKICGLFFLAIPS